jgi:hypothetical protein
MPLSVSAVNVLGQVQNLSWTVLSDGEVRLNVSGLASGLYRMNLVRKNGKVEAQKLRVE